MDAKKDESRLVNSWKQLHSLSRFRPKYPDDHVIRFVFRNFPHEKSKRHRIRMLDLGCGAGRHSVFLASEGFMVNATDISEKGLHYVRTWLKKIALKAACVKKANMERQPFKDEYFNGIIMFGVLCYNDFTGIKKTILEIFRILEKGGKVFILTRTTVDRRYEWKREGCIEDYGQIGSLAYIVHLWMKYPKFGFARTTAIASRWIRKGKITREEAKRLVMEYDHRLDQRAMDDFVTFMGYKPRQFWDMVERF